MKPLHQVDNIEVPPCVYSMKSLHEIVDTNNPDMKTLQEKDRRIADDLLALTEEVKKLSLRLGHAFGESTVEMLKDGLQSMNVGETTSMKLSPPQLPNGITDLVISTSVTQPTFSAVLMGEFLQRHGVPVAVISQKHSSLRAAVPENYLAVAGGPSSRLERSVEQLVFTLIWKDDPMCPSLMHIPKLQTRVIGDANIARYLARLIAPQLYDESDVEASADIDRWIDASVTLCNGSSKEKDSVLKTMNSSLGKSSDYLCNGCITLADVTLLAALLANADHAKTLPKNVKKWFANVSKCFPDTISRFNVPATWSAQ
jgi:hypothetical protein